MKECQQGRAGAESEAEEASVRQREGRSQRQRCGQKGRGGVSEKSEENLEKWSQ